MRILYCPYFCCVWPSKSKKHIIMICRSASHCRNTAAFSAHDVEPNSQNMLNELADSERY